MPDAPCPMPHARCPLPNSQFPTPYSPLPFSGKYTYHFVQFELFFGLQLDTNTLSLQKKIPLEAKFTNLVS